MKKLFPIVYENQSDSASLDNALEFWSRRAVVATRHDDADSGTLRPICRWI